MKSTILFLCLLSSLIASCQTISIAGKVINEDHQPIPNATIKAKMANQSAIADANGFFTLKNIDPSDTLIITAIGYEPAQGFYDGKPIITVMLKRKIALLDEVTVNTGYQAIAKERSTGSFEKINTQLLNRAVSTDWLSRLEGVSNIFFDKRGLSQDPVSIRGRSTIFANPDPLIVVDNFPYEGTLENINPNDIESITILKDAAAASIWGARAGNGVIIITTKKGRYKRKPSLQLNANTTIGNKPGLFYSPNISAKDFIEIETLLFGKGFFDGDLSNTRTRPPLTPVVEILAKRRAGQISATDSMQQIAALRDIDYRNDLLKYFYQRSWSQQYAISYSGGEENISYFFSAGYDKINPGMLKNSNDRLTLSSGIKLTPAKFLELGVNVTLAESRSLVNTGAGISVGGTRSTLYPYAQLADEHGNPLAIVKDYRSSYTDTAGAGQLLSWKYKPLQELYNADNRTVQANKRIGLTALLKLSKQLSVDLLYQYENENLDKRNHYPIETYFTRNLINRYYNPAIPNKNAIPRAGILDQSGSKLLAHNGRLQVNYDNAFSYRHQLSAIAGVEIRQTKTTANTVRIYGYNDNILTYTNVNFIDNLPIYGGLASAQPIPNPASFSERLYRFISLYANTAYTFNKKHTASFSARKDAANIFGVNANQKWVPLWSAGYSWQINKEKFYKIDWLPLLKFRITWGVSGNVDNTMSALTTIRYLSSATFTAQQYAQVRNQSNPELRWEQIAMMNIGLDFSLKDDRLNGTLEYYHKKGRDLIGFAPIDPTTGVQDNMLRAAFRGNVAAMKGNGIELLLNSNNKIGNLTWSAALLFNYATTRVTDYILTSVNASAFTSTAGITVNPVPGRPLYAVYSYRWAGLDPANGDPQGILNGTISKDYAALTNVTIDELVYNGSALPLFFGSLRNTIRYKNFSVSANLLYKLAYYFKRSSINYNSLFTSWSGHNDVAARWRKPGDERTTNVPSLIYPNPNANRDNFYTSSEALIEKADHIRLQDISLSCEISSFPKTWPVKNLELYGYINNIGIIWKSTKLDIDPDYPTGGFPLPTTFAFGCKATF